jgi:hypothetical protein
MLVKTVDRSKKKEKKYILVELVSIEISKKKEKKYILVELVLR